MKQIAVCLICVLFLSGCSKNTEMEQALALRQQVLSSEGVSFLANITADYGDEIYNFSLDCFFDTFGNMTFSVTSPASIAGITGKISNDRGALTFDKEVLVFDLMTDDELSPVSFPWILMRSLRSGYLAACGRAGDYNQLILDDSYEDDALQISMLIDSGGIPRNADIIWKNRRISAVSIESFRFL